MVVRVRDVAWKGRKKGGENARIRVLLLKLCPADPEVWRVRCFVVGSLPVFVSCDMPL